MEAKSSIHFFNLGICDAMTTTAYHLNEFDVVSQRFYGIMEVISAWAVFVCPHSRCKLHLVPKTPPDGEPVQNILRVCQFFHLVKYIERLSVCLGCATHFGKVGKVLEAMNIVSYIHEPLL